MMQKFPCQKIKTLMDYFVFTSRTRVDIALRYRTSKDMVKLWDVSLTHKLQDSISKVAHLSVLQCLNIAVSKVSEIISECAKLSSLSHRKREKPRSNKLLLPKKNECIKPN